VLGLGRFGQSVSLALAREGCEVLAIDRDPDLVREVSKRVTMAVEADVTSKEALEQLGVAEYTRAVVAIGDAVESSLVCALVLKENFKIPEIWAKAINAQQAKILRKIGVTEVVYPELEVGRRVAHALLGHRTEYIPTVEGLAYAALPVSRRLTGQRLADARELAEKGIIVMAVSRTRSSNVTGVGSDRWHLDCVSTAQQFLDGLMRELPGSRTTRTVSLDEPATAICDEATRLNARMIVVGNRRVQGLARMLGAVATDVARRAPCDVLVANTTAE
jgi:trk system potassium uptake protein TrkA